MAALQVMYRLHSAQESFQKECAINLCPIGSVEGGACAPYPRQHLHCQNFPFCLGSRGLCSRLLLLRSGFCHHIHLTSISTRISTQNPLIQQQLWIQGENTEHLKGIQRRDFLLQSCQPSQQKWLMSYIIKYLSFQNFNKSKFLVSSHFSFSVLRPLLLLLLSSLLPRILKISNSELLTYYSQICKPKIIRMLRQQGFCLPNLALFRMQFSL